MSRLPPILERICKVGDLHLALCAAPVGGAEFLGHFSIFRELPPSYFAPGSLAKGSGRFPFASAEGALLHVEKIAREAIERIAEGAAGARPAAVTAA